MKDITEFLEDILNSARGINIADVKPVIEAGPEEGYIGIGDLPDKLKFLYLVINGNRRQVGEVCRGFTHADCAFIDILGEGARPLIEHRHEHDRQDILESIFWQSVKEVFPLETFKATGISICNGWRVYVTYQAPKCVRCCEFEIGEG